MTEEIIKDTLNVLKDMRDDLKSNDNRFMLCTALKPCGHCEVCKPVSRDKK